MAKLTDEDKEKILADFHTGAYSQRELAKKYKVSHVTIGKLTKGLEPKHKEKVTAKIAIETELLQESYQEVTAVNEVVTKAVKHLMFFQNSALKNQKMANEFLSEASSITEVESHARITSKNKETVLGKQAETQIQINNQNNQITEIKRTIVDSRNRNS